MDNFFYKIVSEHIPLILNGVFTLLGVLLGAFITHFLQALGSIKVIIKENNIKYIKMATNPGDQSNGNYVAFDKSDRIFIELKIDFFNSSISPKSLRDLKIVNKNGEVLEIKDKSTSRNPSSRWNSNVIEITNFHPNEMKELYAEATTDRNFFNNDEFCKLYLRYKVGKNKLAKRVLIPRD